MNTMKRLKVRFVDPETRCALEIKEDSMIGIDITLEGELIAYLIPDDYFDNPEKYSEGSEYKELEIQIVE